jgi:hypothetical protein
MCGQKEHPKRETSETRATWKNSSASHGIDIRLGYAKFGLKGKTVALELMLAPDTTIISECGMKSMDALTILLLCLLAVAHTTETGLFNAAKSRGKQSFSSPEVLGCHLICPAAANNELKGKVTSRNCV